MRLLFLPLLVTSSLAGLAEDTCGQLNPDNVRKTVALYESSLRELAARGTFAVKTVSPGASREFAGTFKLMNSDSKFSLTFEIQKTKGLHKNLRTLFDDNTYQVVGDGESILVVRFSHYITTGCDASLYKGNGFDYLFEFPEMPIKPSLGMGNFSVPKADQHQLDSARSTADGVEVAYQAGKATVIKYLLLPEFSFALGRRRVEMIDGSLYSLEERTYKKINGQAIPVAFKHSRYQDGMPNRVIELEFDHVELNASNDPQLFTINGVNFCKRARIVDKSGDEVNIVHSQSGNGFRSDTLSIKAAVAEFREIEQGKFRQAN